MTENEPGKDQPSPAVDPGSDESSRAEAKKVRLRPSLSGRMRAYFFAGVLVTAPMAITFWLAWQVISWVDRSVKPLIPAKYNPETYLPFSVPGIGLIVLFVFLTVVGAFAAGFVGRLLLRISERILARMPVIRSVYGAVKQIFETVLANQSSAFREVVLIEYPRRGIWAIGFITGTTEGEVQEITEDMVVNVFLPTTPNPTSGFLLFVPRRDLNVLSMSVEEGIKMVVSGGIVTPPDRRPPEKRRAKIPATPNRLIDPPSSRTAAS